MLLVSILENVSCFCLCRYIRDGICTAGKWHKLRTLKYCPLKPRGFLALQLVPFPPVEITCPSRDFINYIISLAPQSQKLKHSHLLEIPTQLLAKLISSPWTQLSSSPRSQPLSWNQARCHQVEARGKGAQPNASALGNQFWLFREHLTILEEGSTSVQIIG